MYCTSCGKEIPDNSRFCTFCGNSLNTQENSKMIKLKVTRKKKLLGCAISMKVLVDGNQIAALKNDNSVEIDLPAGEHKLIIDTGGEVTQKVLNLSEEYSKVTVKLVMKFGLVTGKAAIESIENE